MESCFNRLNHIAKLNNRQIQCNNESANQRAEHNNDERLDQTRERFDAPVELLTVERCNIVQHGVERTGFFGNREGGKQPTARIASVNRAPRRTARAIVCVARSSTVLPVILDMTSNASASGVPALRSVPSARLQRAIAHCRSSGPTMGGISNRRSKAARNADERRKPKLQPRQSATIARLAGAIARAVAEDSASTTRVGAGSAAPKPSNTCSKVGTTQIINATVINKARSRKPAG